MRIFLLSCVIGGTALAAPPATATDELVACVDLRKKVDAFSWQYNPFKNPGDLPAIEKTFSQWPRALAAGRAVVVLPGCYADVQLTASGQVAGITYRAGDPLAAGEKSDPRPELRLALERLKTSMLRMQAEITWIESQLATELPPAPGPRISGEYESARPAKPKGKGD